MVKGQLIRPENGQTVLIYISKNVGSSCTVPDLCRAVWNVEVSDNELSYSNYKDGLQHIFSRNIYKYGKGILKEFIVHEKGGYHIKEELNCCVIVLRLRNRPID